MANMKTIGLIGGMSWESSKVYYELVNEMTKERLGGFHSCKCIMYSVDFAEIESLQKQENWKALEKIMVDAASSLKLAGAELLVLCTNTMHLCSEAVVDAVKTPFLHIAEATGIAIAKQQLKKVALLGTRFTMEKDFYSELLERDFNIEVITPEPADRKIIHDVIYKELVHGLVKRSSKSRIVKIINNMQQRGAEGVILGCTELPLLIKQNDVAVCVFDTTKIHAEKAVSMALGL